MLWSLKIRMFKEYLGQNKLFIDTYDNYVRKRAF